MSIGEKVWFRDKRGIVVSYHSKSKTYTILVYNDDEKEWEYKTTQDRCEPRRYITESNIFEPLDKVWVTENEIKSIGIVTGFERGMYSVYKYANHIWTRINAFPGQIEHRIESGFDEVLFNNRKELLKRENWIKWDSPV